MEKYPSQTDGVLLKLSKIYSDNLQGVRKTGAHKSPEVKLYRIMCQIPVKLTASEMTINFEVTAEGLTEFVNAICVQMLVYGHELILVH